MERLADGALRFTRPNGQPLPDVPAPPALPPEPERVLREQNAAYGLRPDATSLRPLWLGERLNLVYAIDVLHPLANPLRPRPPESPPPA